MQLISTSPLQEALLCRETGECANHPTESCSECGMNVCQRHIRDIRVPPDHPRRLCFRCLQVEEFFDPLGNWTQEAAVRML